MPLQSREPLKAPDPGGNSNRRPRATGADVILDEGRIPGMVKESTVWDVYNNEAREIDNELVKDQFPAFTRCLAFSSSLGIYYRSNPIQPVVNHGVLVG